MAEAVPGASGRFMTLGAGALAAARTVQALKGVKALGVSFAAGLISALAMAPVHAWFLLPFTFGAAILLTDGAVRQARPLRSAFARGWAFGTGYFLAGLYWVGYAFMVDPEAHAWLLPFVAVLFPCGLAIFLGFAFLGAAALWPGGPGRIVAFTGAVSASEWLRGTLFTGFPWNLFGYTWSDSPIMMQAAAIMGAYGLSALTVLIFSAPAALIGSASEARMRGGAIASGLGLCGLGVLALFGFMRVPAGPTPALPGVTVRIVQPNVPQHEKWKRELLVRNWQTLLNLTQAPGLESVSHVIWPEAAPPFLLAQEGEALRILGAVLPERAMLVTGSVIRNETSPGRLQFHNGAHVVDGDGAIDATYEKAHLVPFGEYLPFHWLLESIGITKLTGGRGGYTAGAGVRTITLPASRPLGVLICFEIIFPGSVVEPGRRPDWLVNMTDDSWFGPSSGPYQHLGITRVRAVEEGLSVVRAANTGVSAIIDPYGRIVTSLRLNSAGVADHAVPSHLAPTLYAWWGNVVYFLMLAGLGGVAAGLKGSWVAKARANLFKGQRRA